MGTPEFAVPTLEALKNSNNEIISGAFRICGIFKTQYTKYDEQNIFLLSEDFQRISNNLTLENLRYYLLAQTKLQHPSEQQTFPKTTCQNCSAAKIGAYQNKKISYQP